MWNISPRQSGEVLDFKKSRKSSARSLMGNKLSTIVALTAALTPALASAIGLGEITLHSRIGEPLMAEVPIISSHEAPLATCFSMVALRGSDFPVITNAKPRLIKRGSSYILQIVGTRPISEPIFAVGIRANCGYDIEREYVLIPEPPIELAQSAGTMNEQPAPTGKVGKTSSWVAREGETLEDIADAQAPASAAERQRLLAGLKRANPTLDADMPLAEGTAVRMPSPQRAKAPRPERAEAPDTQGARNDRPAAPKAPSHKPKQASAPTTDKTDRLVLGAASAPLPPSRTGNSGLSSLAETEERLLKLETTLHLLTREMEKMDQAIDLATKAIEVQNRLQQTTSRQDPPPGPSIQTHAAPAMAASSTNWPELLLSAAIGAGISVGMAQYLGRRRRYPGDEEAPLAFSGYRAEVAPSVPPPMQPVAKAPSATPQPMALRLPDPPPLPEPDFPVPSLPDCDIPLQPEPDFIEAKNEDEHSVLELAEIMLSFGRLRGAAETLAEHIDETMSQSIEPWSMLLDLYRRGGMRDEFEALAVKMRQRFNARIPDWNESTTPISGLKMLEDFPHIIQKVCSLWGTQQSVDYLYSLVHDTRTGQRNGFPLEVVEEIALLMHVLVSGYGLESRH